MSYCTWNNYTLTYYNWVTTYFQVFVSIIPQTSGVTDEKLSPSGFRFEPFINQKKLNYGIPLLLRAHFALAAHVIQELTRVKRTTSLLTIFINCFV